MKKYSNYLLFFTFCLLSACKFGGESVEITYRNFDDVITQRQNLRMVFNSNLAGDVMLNDWRDEVYANFSPKVEGKFKWVASNELEFSPDEGFAPSTDYELTFTDEIGKHVDFNVILGEASSVNFHTEYLKLSSASLAWSLGTKGTPELVANIQFNYPVNPSDVNSLLDVKVKDKKVNYEITTPTISRSIKMTLTADTEWENETVNFELAEGLGLTAGEYKAKAMETVANVPGKEKFEVLKAEAKYMNTDPFVRVTTSQMVLGDDIKQYLKITPSISFKVEKKPDGFAITGPFEIGQDYKLTINKGIKGIFRTALAENYSTDLIFGNITPSIAFSEKKALYLTSKGEKEIAMKIVNVPKVHVTVWKVYENNILEFLRRAGMLNGYYGQYDRSYFYGTQNYGDIVFETDVESANLKKKDGMQMLSLNFNDPNDFKGLYMVEVKSEEERWLKKSQIVAISDVGLIAKKAKDAVYVWTNSIQSSASLAGVEVSLVSTNNQKVLTQKTDESGFVKFENLSQKAGDFNFQMVTAQKGKEFNFMHFSQNAVSKASFEVGGYYGNSTGLLAFIYGDRNLYRPGETANIKAIVRNENWKSPGEMPIKLKVIAPNGKEFLAEKGMLSAEGAYETSFEFPADVITGTFYAEVSTGNDIMLTSYPISVEEFMPDRIKVLTALDKEAVTLSEEFKLEAQAFNLFGPPAVGRNHETTLQLNRKHFRPKGFNDYNFYISGKSTDLEEIARSGKTDDEGKYVESFQISDSYANMGLLSAAIYTTVFDETGRPVNRRETMEIATQDVFYGIREFPYYIRARQPMTIPFIALNRKGEVVKAKNTQVRVIRYYWHSVLEKGSRNRYRYVSRKQEEVLVDKVMEISGKATTYTFVPAHSGSFEVQIGEKGTDTYVSRSFYSYGWGSTSSNSFEVDREGKIKMELDKEEYQVGETAKVLFKLPFEGKLLVTIERDKLIKHFEFSSSDKKAKELSIPITEEMLPNAYITATLIKPITDNDIPLTVAHGFQSIKVNKESNKIALSITAPEKSRAKRKQTIKVKTKRPMSDVEVTVAVVDEGILQIKNYKTPSPYGFFYQKRALQVNSYDLYPRLFPEYIAKQGFGYGEGTSLGKRANPLANKRVKLVSFWSGTLKTNSNGEVSYEIDIPQFSGDLRIMAVATKAGAFGSTFTNMKVADPLVISAGLPRFASPRDQLKMPVTLTNTTDKDTDVAAKVKVEGKLTLVGDASQKISIPANSEKTVLFELNAKNAIGQAAVTVDVTTNSETFTNKTELSVRPTTSLLKTTGAGVVNTAAPVLLDFKKDYLTSSVDAKLFISKSPVVEFTDHLAYLVRYPHGCVEQTTSAAFPQLYFAELTKDLGSLVPLRGDPNYYVSEAVKKLQTMQMYDGGLSYWQGGSYGSWWGSIYATHFLMEAKKKGFEVNQGVLDKLYGYLKGRLRKNTTYDYTYRDMNNQRITKQIAPRDAFYSLFVLALAGQPDVATMNYYKGKPNLLSIDSRYMLACTYLLTGDQKNFKLILPEGFIGERSFRTTGRNFHSYIRDQALALTVLIETNPDHPQIGIMAKQLSKELKNGYWYSTQERAFAMLALGKLAKQAQESSLSATVLADGQEVGVVKNGALTLNTAKIAGKRVSIKAQGGQGQLYYFWEMEGLNASGEYVQEDKYLKVRRTFYDRQGNQLAPTAMKQNDLVVVKISLQTSTNSRVENVVVTDMLPAGLEVENPRIGNLPNMKWIKNQSYPQHADFRDDRVHFFTTATNKPKDYYYVVRAVSMGTFQLGPVSADAMYDAEYHSYHGAGTVIVK